MTGTTTTDPWSPDAMVWPLLAVIDDSLDEPWCTTLAAHLGHFATGEERELRQGRRYAVARRLAGLFASYARQRPQLLTDWKRRPAGRPFLATAAVGRAGHSASTHRHRTSGMPRRCARLRVRPRRSAGAGSRCSGTPACPPPRSSCWTRWPSTTTCTCGCRIPATSSGAHCRAGMAPSRAARTPATATSTIRCWRPSAATCASCSARYPHAAHRRIPLHRSISRDAAGLAAVRYRRRHAVRPEGADPPASRIARSRCTPATGRPGRSTCCARCFSACSADDPTLEPRDILVMCPDIETYAPLITAGFGLGDVVRTRAPGATGCGCGWPIALWCRPIRCCRWPRNCWRWPGSRAAASEVPQPRLEPPRCGPGSASPTTIWRPSPAGCARPTSGGASTSRTAAPYGVDFVHNTWRFGIDRVLAGVAMSGRLARLAGHHAAARRRQQQPGRTGRAASPSFVQKLHRTAIDALSGTRPLGRLAAGADRGYRGAGLRRRGVADRSGCSASSPTSPRPPDPARSPCCGSATFGHCSTATCAGRPTRANFRTGTLTVCTMVPMRSVPHRVVCLVGLDDGVFPRLGVVDGDDVLARDPMTGERDIRSEDRQLLLDAIGAATETLVITYTGANEYSGQPRPARGADRRTARHPRRPPPSRRRPRSGDPAPVAALRRPATCNRARLIPDAPFTFDPTVLDGRPSDGRAAAAQQPAFISGPLPAPPPDDVSLADLIAFFKRSGQGLLPRAGLHAAVGRGGRVADAMPVDIDALQEWTVGDRMLADMHARHDPGRTPSRPSGGAARCRRASSAGAGRSQLRDQAAAAGRRGAAPPRAPTRQAFDVDIDLGAGSTADRHGDRRCSATAWSSVTYSKLDGEASARIVDSVAGVGRRMRGSGWSAVCIGRPPRGTTPAAAGPGRPRTIARRPAARSGRHATTRAADAAAAADQDVLCVGRRPRTSATTLTQAANYRWKQRALPTRSGSPRRCGRGAAAPPTWPNWSGLDDVRGSGCGCRCCRPRKRA